MIVVPAVVTTRSQTRATSFGLDEYFYSLMLKTVPQPQAYVLLSLVVP
jgi:hypothetical protein